MQTQSVSDAQSPFFHSLHSWLLVVFPVIVQLHRPSFHHHLCCLGMSVLNAGYPVFESVEFFSFHDSLGAFLLNVAFVLQQVDFHWHMKAVMHWNLAPVLLQSLAVSLFYAVFPLASDKWSLSSAPVSVAWQVSRPVLNLPLWLLVIPATVKGP